MTDRSSKVFYLFKGDQRRAGSLAEHNNRMKHGLKVKTYLLDVEMYGEVFVEFLKKRNPTKADDVPAQFAKNDFLLVNKFDDMWWHDMNLVTYFREAFFDEIFNFYQGTLMLQNHDVILMNQCGENDVHLVSYVPNAFTDHDAQKKLKYFRMFARKNTDKFFHFKYWVIEDEKLAKELGINTSGHGDIYCLREAETPFNPKKPNISVSDFPFTSEKLLKYEDVEANIDQSWVKIQQLIFESPIIVHNYHDFNMLRQKYQNNCLVVYCDPAKHGVTTYNQVLSALAKARKEKPINLTPPKNDKQASGQQRDQDILFVLSTDKNLMPTVVLHEDHPQGVFCKPDNQFVDLLQ